MGKQTGKCLAVWRKVKTRAFDTDLQRDLERAGGAKYAAIAMLAYRQTLAATKLVADTNGEPLLFPKENFSNGCIATVDVIYPMAPQFLLFAPALAKALVVSNLDFDNRRLYTKLDWITWTATLTGSRADFEALVAPVFDLLNATPHQVPMSDWYWTHDATKTGFQARSVVGGVFLRLLYDDGVWKKWGRLR